MSFLTDDDLTEIKKLPSIERYIKQHTSDENKDELLDNDRFKVRFYINLILKCILLLFSKHYFITHSFEVFY